MIPVFLFFSFFFFNDTATTEIYTLSLHDALPICAALNIGCDQKKTSLLLAELDQGQNMVMLKVSVDHILPLVERSEEHTSELQSPCNLVCRLLLEKKKKETMSSTYWHTVCAPAST